MTVRASLHLNNQSANLVLYPGLNETDDHLRLKLAAFILYFDSQPSVEMGATHVALCGQEFWPDLLAADFSGAVTLWVECGRTTRHKLSKVRKRFRDARLVVITPTLLEGRQQAKEARDEGLADVEVWSFPSRTFEEWRLLTKEKNDIIGESTSTSMNLVINDSMFVLDLVKADPL